MSTELWPVHSSADIVRELQHCDAVISLSRYEGFGYTALEAMACGKPFLGFRTSGLAEVVDETCGFLVDLGDTATLAMYCRELARNPSLARRLGVNGRVRAETFFSSKMSLDAYAEIYAILLKERERTKSSNIDL